MRTAAYIGGLLGLALLLALVLRTDLAAMLQTLEQAGWRLLWLVPYRALFFLLYAIGWRCLLEPSDPTRRADLSYLFWVTTIREAIDRLLPVASVGGGVVAVRMLRWRGLAAPPVAASVICEVLLTLFAAYLFTATGLLWLLRLNAHASDYHRLLLGFLLSLPVPIGLTLVLRYGSVFRRLQSMLRALVGASWAEGTAETAASLDAELQAGLRRRWRLAAAGSLQLAAFVSGSFEVWLALRLFGHPVGVGVAVVLESMTQAVRHLAFFVPAGLGVQEAGLILIGETLGISGELALALSMAKRMREVLCGVPALLSWQWTEARRLRA
ncbi:MAG: lysylphosphatidylglycerol synthase domain-containing protein [Steroidobacteraceae bacterium]